MSALSVPGEDADPFPSVPTSEASEGLLGAAEGAVPHLVLSPAERTREALWAASISLEHARVHGPVDSRVTAAYASRVVDNSRRLARCDAALHLDLLRGHVVWLRSLPTGGGLR
jgi:hypothetical protein